MKLRKPDYTIERLVKPNQEVTNTEALLGGTLTYIDALIRGENTLDALVDSCDGNLEDSKNGAFIYGIPLLRYPDFISGVRDYMIPEEGSALIILSHTQSRKAYISIVVMDHLKKLLEDQNGIAGIRYYTRSHPNGRDNGKETLLSI